MTGKITAMVFDLGGVLIDWDPRYLYRPIFNDDAAMEHFLSEICSPAWNEQQDSGRPFAEALRDIAANHPGYETLAAQWLTGFEKMMPNAIEGSLALLKTLRTQGTPLYALTNWPADTFPVALRKFDFLSWFNGIVVSGTERTRKPQAPIFRILLDRYGLAPQECFYTDDNLANLTTARDLGFRVHHFTSPENLAAALREAGLLPRA
ncbi:MAG: HAD family phosphatase [Ancalomicrobiaceae bacterium]|nr:HAD family phosphatase [Ancalomicrobiaceae bacterium]